MLLKTLVEASSDKSVIKGCTGPGLGGNVLYHPLYGSGTLLKMSESRRMEGCRTAESVKREREVTDGGKPTDGSFRECSTFMFPCLSIGRRELLQPFC